MDELSQDITWTFQGDRPELWQSQQLLLTGTIDHGHFDCHFFEAGP